MSLFSARFMITFELSHSALFITQSVSSLIHVHEHSADVSFLSDNVIEVSICFFRSVIVLTEHDYRNSIMIRDMMNSYLHLCTSSLEFNMTVVCDL